MTEVVLAAVLGFLFAVGTYLVLRRDVVSVVWGVIVMSQAANVYLITMSSLAGTGVPIIDAHGAHGGAPETVDPLVQALVLTAIVIGFGTTAFGLVLTYRTYEEHGTIDMFTLADTTRLSSDSGTFAPDGGERPDRPERSTDGDTGASPTDDGGADE